MRHWFHRNFEDPAQETPYNTQEGGYLYIWGGPYEAGEELYSEFGALVPEERIQELAEEIEGEDGIYDWAPGGDHPDMRQREEEWLSEQEEEERGSQSETLDQIISRLKAGIKPTFGNAYELEQRRVIRERLDGLRTALAEVAPPHGGIGHNNPPPDEETPQSVAVTEARKAEEAISAELAKPEPDALEIANATSRLRTALGWLGKKLDKGVDVLITIAVVAGVHHAPEALPPMLQLMADIVQHVTQWLSYVSNAF
jgi:hypothetical protein